MKAYTDLEQSRKLAEILPIESADMAYFCNGKNELLYPTPFIINDRDGYYSRVYCWSLAALMDLLPSKFTEKGKYSETTYNIDIRKYALTENVDLYQIAYGNYKFDVDGQYSFKDMVNTGEKENLIDAAFQMICWLKENKKI